MPFKQPDSVSQEIFLAVDSEQLSAADITAILGLVPDESWDRGDSWGTARKERKRRFSRWSISERAFGAYVDEEELVARLVARLQPVSANFAALPGHCSVHLGACITESHDIFGWGLSADQVQFLGKIGAALGLSVVVRSRREDERTT